MNPVKRNCQIGHESAGNVVSPESNEETLYLLK